jgi:hypothetical protein
MQSTTPSTRSAFTPPLYWAKYVRNAFKFSVLANGPSAGSPCVQAAIQKKTQLQGAAAWLHGFIPGNMLLQPYQDHAVIYDQD